MVNHQNMGFEKFSSVGSPPLLLPQESMTIKSNFARTCNRFSQFLKERRSFGDVDFTSIASPKLETKENVEIFEKKSLNLFPLTSSSSTVAFRDSTKNNMAYSTRNPSNEESKKTTASMTIIYDGKVIVFDDLKEDMAQEIMSLASNQGHNKNKTILTTNLSHALSHLPIQRGASLHRFMEKRKDRIAANAPYQLNNLSSRKQLSKQQEEHQLELKLG